MIDHSQDPGVGRNLSRYHPPDLTEAEETIAQSGVLDPEHPDELFEPFTKRGLFRKGSRLARIRGKLKRKRGK